MSIHHAPEQDQVPHQDIARPRIARTIYRFSALIILAWVAIAVLLTVAVPPLAIVEKEHSISLSPDEAPSFKAQKRISEAFNENTSDSVAMVVLEGQKSLGDDGHRFYDQLIHQFEADPHIRHIQNFWDDPLTAAAAQSTDGKAVYVQLNLAGKPASTEANKSIEVLRNIVERTPPPPGIKAFVTGPAAIVSDTNGSGNKTVALITLVSLAVIFGTLLLVYRSVLTVIILLLLVAVELQIAQGLVAFLGDRGFIGLTTFAINLLVAIGIAAGTDYGIFFLGRYQEARQAGEEKEAAFYTTYHGTAKVVLASGSTIAGALFCLSFTRLPFFQPIGVPCAVGVLVAVAVALTLVPAVLAVGTRRKRLFEPRRKVKSYGWRRIGTAIVRWPAPIFAATMAIALIGLLTLPGYNPSYNDMKYLPKGFPGEAGFLAAQRHFAQARMMSPEMLMVESDHDLRNSADFLVLNKLAKGILAVPGVSRVQSATRPEGTPIGHTSIPFLLSMSQAGQLQNVAFQRERMDDILKQADELTKTIGIMQHMSDLLQQIVATTHDMVRNTHDIQDVTEDLRNRIADFEDFFRPIRAYFYWDKHCYDIPICWSLRSIFDSIDGVDAIDDKLKFLVTDLDHLDAIIPQILTQFPEMIATMESMRTMMLAMHSTMSGTLGMMDENGGNTTAMGKAFDAAKDDESFYIPPDVFQNKDFKRVMKVFLSPDGKAARMLISLRDDPGSPEGTSRVEGIRTAAEEALKGTPLEDAKLYVTGTAAMTKDLVEGSKFDLMIAGVAAICLIFVIMLVMTRSFVAALVIVGTVLLSLGASFGLSVLTWQYLLGIQIHWVVLAMSVIVLLAVGSDYNLLLVSRMKEELDGGIKTGIIRAMGGTGKVVTNAGLVFAFTMASMLVSDLRIIGQLGSTIAMGLMFDTLVVRAFMTPSIASLLGRWFWWPRQVRPRPASSLLRAEGPRPLVRALLRQPR
jgi:putative drug exporter of the RND superfamily